MSWLRLIIVQVVLLAAVSCFAAEPGVQKEAESTIVLRQTAHDWIQVGILQSKKGLYDQAEKSFLAAQEYQEYLPVEEQKQLDKNLAEARQGAIERQAVLEHVKKAKELLSQNQAVKARAHFEKVRNSPYLTELERKQIDKDIKGVDKSFDTQQKEMAEIYNRSVQLYRAGEIEKARDGFVEVAKYGMLVVPKGQTAEDYLLQIDSILTERLKGEVGVKAPPAPMAAPSENETPKAKNTYKSTPPENEVSLLKPESQQPAIEKKAVEKPQMNPPAEETQESTTAAESDKDARIKIARDYTNAVVEDAAGKVDYDIQQGDFDRAVSVVRSATQVVKDNRSLIGDELFSQFSVRLKQLADKIIQARKSS